MNHVEDIHRLAMELHDIWLLWNKGTPPRFGVFTGRALRLACDLETLAAEMMDGIPVEPSRSVFYRSAATMCQRCGRYESAIRLIKAGLAGNPPAEIRAELEELMGQVAKAMEANQ